MNSWEWRKKVLAAYFIPRFEGNRKQFWFRLPFYVGALTVSKDWPCYWAPHWKTGFGLHFIPQRWNPFNLDNGALLWRYNKDYTHSVYKEGLQCRL